MAPEPVFPMPVDHVATVERVLRGAAQVLEREAPASLEEANAILEDRLSDLRWEPTTPLERAQELAYQAREMQSRTERVKLARKAIETCADCADAYLVLADELAESPAQEKDFASKALAAAERALGPDACRVFEGQFWSAVTTRPYMRAGERLAFCLWDLGEHDRSIEHCQEMIRLNPNDNQGVRHSLIYYAASRKRPAG